MCTPYEFKFWDLILPPIELLYKICVIRDKSKLFLVSLIRFIIYYLLFEYLLNSDIITYKGGGIKMYGFYFILIILILCSMSVILVLLKQPSLDIDVIDEEVENRIDELNLKSDTKSSLVTRSLGRTETEKVFLPEVLEVPGRIKSIS